MNDLKLPPRRTLPPEVRQRIRTSVNTAAPRSRTVRYRTPLTVAASVVVVVAGIMALHPLAGPRNGLGPGSARTAPAPLTIGSSDAQTSKDLADCGYAAATGPRYKDFPRWVPVPVFTAVRQGGDRIVAFRAEDGKPGFCEVEPDRVTVSDPTAAPMPIASTIDGKVLLEGWYLTRSGLLAGVAKGVTALECSVTTTDLKVISVVSPILEGGLFVTDVGGLRSGDVIDLWGRDDAGTELARGSLVYDPTTVRPVGATGKRR